MMGSVIAASLSLPQSSTAMDILKLEPVDYKIVLIQEKLTDFRGPTTSLTFRIINQGNNRSDGFKFTVTTEPLKMWDDGWGYGGFLGGTMKISGKLYGPKDSTNEFYVSSIPEDEDELTKAITSEGKWVVENKCTNPDCFYSGDYVEFEYLVMAPYDNHYPITIEVSPLPSERDTNTSNNLINAESLCNINCWNVGQYLEPVDPIKLSDPRSLMLP